MRVSLELFLLDNLIMDYLILRLGSVFAGVRFRRMRALPFAAAGAIYSALAFSVFPELNRMLPKILLGAAMSIPLMRGKKTVLRAILSLYFAAFLSGGMMFAVTLLFGGTLEGGALIGTTPVRAVLAALLVLPLFPRIWRELLALIRARETLVPVRIQMTDRTLQLQALIDSGNLLTEPLSGKPVVIVQRGLLAPGGRPVPYRTIDGNGALYAQNTVRTEVRIGDWLELDVMVAESPQLIEDADAILPGILFEHQRRAEHDQNDTREALAALLETPAKKDEERLVHFFRRNASGPVCSGGGATVDRAADARGDGGEKRAD